MLVDKTVSFKSAHDMARMKDPAVLAAARESAARPGRSARALHAARAAIVEVTLTDGRKFTERVDDVRGTSENPMSRATKSSPRRAI